MTKAMIVVDRMKQEYIENLLGQKCQIFIKDMKDLCEQDKYKEMQKKCEKMNDKFEGLMLHDFNQHMERIEKLCHMEKKEKILVELEELENFLKEVQVVCL